MPRRKCALVLKLLSATLLLFADVSPALANTLRHGPSTYITNRYSGLMADFSIRPSCYIPDDATCPNGTPIVLGRPGQRAIFSFHLVGGQGYEVRWFGDYCLDVAGFGTNNGAKVILWQCTGNTNQRWMPQIFEDGDPNAKILMGIHSGKCLDADNPAFTSGRVPGPGALLQVWDCVPDTEAGNLANQDWAFQW